MKRIKIEGQRFGRLIVLNLDHSTRVISSGRIRGMNHYYRCICDCGGYVITSRGQLRSGQTKSCGCYHKDRARQAKTTHGFTYTRLNRIWRAMKSRCGNPRVLAYKYYGGRGIKVCSEWKNNFIVFHEWAFSHGYEEDLDIDRIDSDGDYEPDNCHWITKSENSTKANIERWYGRKIS